MKVIEGTEQLVNVAEVITHENYSQGSRTNNDIALLRLASDITYSIAVKPVCLPRTEVATDMLCVSTGWGDTQGE